jgi:hypothetical protein
LTRRPNRVMTGLCPGHPDQGRPVLGAFQCRMSYAKAKPIAATASVQG